jgi:hypothetical protein
MLSLEQVGSFLIEFHSPLSTPFLANSKRDFLQSLFTLIEQSIATHNDENLEKYLDCLRICCREKSEYDLVLASFPANVFPAILYAVRVPGGTIGDVATRCLINMLLGILFGSFFFFSEVISR